MNLPSVTHANARPYVLKCQPFNGARNSHSSYGHSVAGRRVGHLYVVWSYGHWPMFVCDTRTDTWFVNTNKYSPTTSKQQWQCWPHGKDLAGLPHDELIKMVNLAREGA